MMGKSVWIWIGFALAGAAAQTNTFPVTGNVGIGTTSPGYPLQVNGSGDMQMGISSSDANAHVWTLQSSGSGSLVGTFQIIDRTVGASRLLVDTSGNVGIGTTSPQSNLQISTYGPYLFSGGGGLATTYASSGIGFNLYRGSDNNWHTMSDGANGGGYAFLGNTNGQLFLLQVPSAGNVSQSLADSSVWPGKIALSVLNGNVGIGTTNPGATLEVNGNIALTSGSGASIKFPDNTVQSTAWTGALGGGDYAESIEVSEDRSRYEPGDLLVIDKHNPSKFAKSTEPYSTMVAGIYSTKPGVVGRRQTTPKSADEIPMAVVGIVPAKVSAENGAIEAGDLLVSSPTPGVAMKGTDRTRMLGAVVGKAMGTLDAGTGTIEVLVTLQ